MARRPPLRVYVWLIVALVASPASAFVGLFDLLGDRLRSDVAENRSTRTSGTLGHLLAEWLDQHPGERETVDDDRFLADSFIIPAVGGVKLTRLSQSGPSLIEKFYAELRRWPTLSAVHRSLVPGLLRGAAASIRALQ